jgi:hypothetical protein
MPIRRELTEVKQKPSSLSKQKSKYQVTGRLIFSGAKLMPKHHGTP